MPRKQKEKTKNSYLAAKKPAEETTVEKPDYSEDERKYLSTLQKRLESAKTLRDAPLEEYDNLTFTEHWLVNERKANTSISAVKNKIDTPFESGTLRRKLLAFLSSDIGMNFKADISAYNEDEVLVNYLGNAMEDIIEKTEENENDEEWRMMRQYEKMKHGYVFVEDLWENDYITEKTISQKEIGKKTGVVITTKRTKQLGMPKRHIISGLSVYLGSLKHYMLEEQPYLYTVSIEDYETLEMQYTDWEMWPYVSKAYRSFGGNASESLVNNQWRLFGSEVKNGQVEVIRYQDKPHNEFQLILNGIPMLPIGYPLTKVSPDGEYTLIQQNLEPIRHDFAYGKSFVFKNKNLVAILDEMKKLAVLKTQQSYAPSLLNLSNRVISRSVFMPATITRGIKQGELVPVMSDMGKGVTNSEFAMIHELKNDIDENTASQTFTGHTEKGQVTATQIIELQRQARIMMGLLTLSSKLLEKKLASKRLVLILDKWFDPVDKKLDEARTMLKNKYRRLTLSKNIDGKGRGVSMVIPTENIPSSQEIQTMEEETAKSTGMPAKIIMLNPKELKKIKLTWVITINPRPIRSSELSKLLFAAEMKDAVALGLRLNPDYIEQRFAEIWDEDPSKMFLKQEEIPPQMQQQPGQQPGQQTKPPSIAPQIKVPGQQGVEQVL